MTQQTSPFLEAKYGWDYGESGWNTGMDENLTKFSFLFDKNIDGIVSALPSAVNGTAYFLTTDNRIYFGVSNSWYSAPTPKWFTVVLRSTGANYQFNGSSLVAVPNNTDLSSQVQAIQVTLSSLGTAAFQPTTYFASQSALDVASAQANSYTDASVATKLSKSGDTLTGAINFAAAVTLTDSATPAIGAATSNTVILNGSTSITGFDTITAGARRNVKFNTARTLVNSASLVLPTKANIYTAVGDRAEFISLGGGVWECINYYRISGYSVANVTSKDLGAVGSGVVSDVAALTLANTLALTSLTIVGNCLIDSNLTINCPVTMTSGSKFTVNNGVTLTLGSNFTAPVSQVFDCVGTGAVVFNRTRVVEGYPEWWGATTNNGGFDCGPTIQACNIALSITQLQAADYYVATSLNLLTSGRTLRGAGAEYYGITGASTRIISMTGSNHVIVIGPPTQPASINDFPRGIIVEDLQVTRAVAPVISSSCAGVYSRWTLYQQLNNVKSSESIFGFQYVGTVQPRNNSCQAFRSIAGTGGGSETFRGFFVDGTTVLTGVAGGNASCHWDECVSGCVLSSATSYGFYINGSWADTFVKNFEASVCTVGIYLQGDTTATLNYRTVDMHIINPIIDQFSFAGIFVDGTSPFATISVQGGYAAPVSTGTPTGCIYVNNSQGAVNISGGFQSICGPSTTITGGLVVVGSVNVVSIGNIVTEISTNGVILNNSNLCRVEDQILNYGRTGVSGVSLQGTSARNSIKPLVNGKASGFSYGIQLQGASTTGNSVDPTGVGSAPVSVARLHINGAAVTTVGLTNTNYVYGVVA